MCETTQLVAAALDGSSQVALLLNAKTGQVCHANPVAKAWLEETSPFPCQVSSVLCFNDDVDWKQATQCQRVSATTTRTDQPHPSSGMRPVQVTQLPDCPCGCGEQYVVMYIQQQQHNNKNEQQVREQQDLAQAMINASFDPMLQIDQDGIIRLVNLSACWMLGYTQDELIGQNVNIICGGSEHANHHHNEYIQRYLETGEKRIIGRKRQVVARRKDGSEFPVELGVQEVVQQNRRRAFCGYMRDLTQQHKDKRALRKQAAIIQDKFFCGDDDDRVGSQN